MLQTETHPLLITLSPIIEEAGVPTGSTPQRSKRSSTKFEVTLRLVLQEIAPLHCKILEETAVKVVTHQKKKVVKLVTDQKEKVKKVVTHQKEKVKKVVTHQKEKAKKVGTHQKGKAEKVGTHQKGKSRRSSSQREVKIHTLVDRCI
jgi:hypothetical protein